jgi:hypothetical protein
MRTASPFSVREFLRDREALLVHFNTPMTHHPTGFPCDLHNAKTLSGCRLSFSTIQAGDKGPSQGGNPADANAGGSVGIVVDVKDFDSVITVDASDSGSGPAGTLGKQPDARTCADSIDHRRTANEWLVQNYTPLGIFVFLPVYVFVKGPDFQGECPSNLIDIIKNFPDDRIFSTNGTSFIECDHDAGNWVTVSFREIFPS